MTRTTFTLLGSFLGLVMLAGCASTPMTVEYRVPPTQDPAMKAAEDAALQKRIRERSQGQEAL